MYHVAKALSGSGQFRTSVNGAQCWSLKKAALLKCLKDRNDIYEWVLGSHFGSLIDLEQDMGQWSLMLRSGTLTSVIMSGLFVYIWSIRVADIYVILVGDFTSWVKPSSVIVESQEECGFSKSILNSPSTRISAWGFNSMDVIYHLYKVVKPFIRSRRGSV